MRIEAVLCYPDTKELAEWCGSPAWPDATTTEPEPAADEGAAGAAAAGTGRRVAGSHVEVHGLSGAVELNGRQGSVVRWMEGVGRYEVRLEESGKPRGRTVRVKPGNVRDASAVEVMAKAAGEQVVAEAASVAASTREQKEEFETPSDPPIKKASKKKNTKNKKKNKKKKKKASAAAAEEEKQEEQEEEEEEEEEERRRRMRNEDEEDQEEELKRLSKLLVPHLSPGLKAQAIAATRRLAEEGDSEAQCLPRMAMQKTAVQNTVVLTSIVNAVILKQCF